MDTAVLDTPPIPFEDLLLNARRRAHLTQDDLVALLTEKGDFRCRQSLSVWEGGTGRPRQASLHVLVTLRLPNGSPFVREDELPAWYAAAAQPAYGRSRGCVRGPGWRTIRVKSGLNAVYADDVLKGHVAGKRGKWTGTKKTGGKPREFVLMADAAMWVAGVVTP